MLDKLFLVNADFQDYKDLSENFDDGRLNQSIRESQVDEMRAFLGDELYLIMQTDFTEPDTWATIKYEELFEGKDYTYNDKLIRFYGVKPALVLYAYSRLLDLGNLNLTRQGAVQFIEDEVSEPTEQPQIMTKVRSAKAQGLVYLADAKKFLESNIDLYPEFSTKDSQVVNKTGMTMFKV